ncbi:MAG: DUF6702 family protein [Bacteroidota bacterium]
MKQILARPFLFFLLIIPLMGFVHPFYFSLTQIDHNPKTESLEITLKIFTGDMEQALAVHGAGPLFLGEGKENKAADRYLRTYLERNFKLKVNGESRPYEYLGKEVELETLWIYVEVLSVPEVKEIEVTNKLLIEIYEEQQNVVQIKVGDQKKGALLRKGLTTDTVPFD